MIPYDGSGYGVSMYWRYQMKGIAEQCGESCPCWSTKEPLIKFNSENIFMVSIECFEKTIDCKPTFHTTEAELMKKFQSLYNMSSI